MKPTEEQRRRASVTAPRPVSIGPSWVIFEGDKSKLGGHWQFGRQNIGRGGIARRHFDTKAGRGPLGRRTAAEGGSQGHSESLRRCSILFTVTMVENEKQDFVESIATTLQDIMQEGRRRCEKELPGGSCTSASHSHLGHGRRVTVSEDRDG